MPSNTPAQSVKSQRNASTQTSMAHRNHVSKGKGKGKGKGQTCALAAISPPLGVIWPPFCCYWSGHGWSPPYHPPPVYPYWSSFDDTLRTSNEARDQFVELERELSDTLRTSIPARDQFVTQVILSTGHCSRDLFLKEVYRSLPNCDEDLLSQILLAFAKMKKSDSLDDAFISNAERKQNGKKRPRKPPRCQMSLTDSGDGAPASSSHPMSLTGGGDCVETGVLDWWWRLCLNASG